ncbi:FxSxx-COOH system tetratricopeptide repeat protein [Streptomyces scabiei]|uniref:FxSxx-COOH system tetratricopeptide repeat protein n=1 Tax=Streptomyces scabiei TaxID=1930 RepID=UPI001B31B1D1|nr:MULTISPECIES: FxSxx-COOH system tetratricopeptide repeat protein [Streptomyces]MBP5889809.1 tetratricopeptide repeat protein [Streptomyces sp. LBUM 1481]MBP5919845.1 tetratricopeptide repeat protein [Streptomyces sp. LBUM 1483]MDX2687499.1 FxSxx-COOH system tetratricopeptide repeat protein [Streptomyces scabiei]MDX2752541.1 FxSxx-COOH system tetratricopeptide repeat protein [Streptomyces scabiei]MDX2806783.1 FxSxx-COOH system tetratricopeptide repeat protein [Streptomyces scabiei]
MTHDERGRGTIITFYSFKGGTGRTMALVNTAWILASNGLRVLVVDWDLEAPGLHTYLQPLLADPELTESAGVIEMVSDFAQHAVAPLVGSGAAGPPPQGERGLPEGPDHRERARVDRYAVGTELRLPPGGKLDLLPAGVQDPDTYAVKVSTFDWGTFYRMGGADFLTALRDDMAARYDYVLIDSRTGLSDTASICTVVMPDIVVDCFTLSRQGVDGAAHVARSIRRIAHTQRDIRIVPVPMRVEDAGRDRLEAGRYQARNRFAPFLDWLPPEELDQYWSSVEIPYKPSYAYEEIPATVGERRQDGTLLSAFERLTARLTDNRVTRLNNMPEPYRRTLRAEYERTSPIMRKDFYVSYAATDRLWADWTVAVLRAAGYEATLAPVEADDDMAAPAVPTGLDRTLAGEGRMVVLLSPQYTALPQAREIWQRTSRRDPSGQIGMVVALRVDDSAPSAEFASLSAVSLTGVTAEEAVARLLTTVDRAGSVEPGTRPAAVGLAVAARLPGTPPQVIGGRPQRNVVFTGRRTLIERLRDSLLSGTTAVLPQALYGLGGVGKTQLALEYAYRFESDYDLVWWINAAEPTQIRQDLNTLAGHLGVPLGGKDLTAVCNEVLDKLRRGTPHARWLLVYDNAEKPADLDGLVPVSGPGHHILITSRNPAWAERAARIEVDLFTREESVALLRRYNQSLESAEAARVAEELGDFPLAVSLAAASLQESAMPVDTYVEMLRTQMTDILRSQSAPDYPTSAAASWSLDRLKTRTPAAAVLLQLCAFFGPDPIPRDMLNSRPALELLEGHDPSLSDPLLMSRLYGEVVRNGLAQVDQRTDTLTLHRLIQRVLRDQLSPEEQVAMRDRAQAVLGQANPKDPDESDNWRRYATLLPHLWPTRAQESDNLPVRQWICDTVRYLWRSGDADTANSTAERVLDSWLPRFGEDDAHVLRLRTELGNALRDQGRLPEAYDVTRDVHERAARVLGPDHPYTLGAAMSLGSDLRSVGRYADAMASDRETLRRTRRLLGDGHARTLAAAGNLAVSEFLFGDRQAARETNREILKQRREIFGPDQRATLNSATNYARDLRAAGALHEALKLLQDTLKRSRRALGPDHLITFRASLGVAVLHRRLGEYEEAYRLTSDTLQQATKQLGADHHDTLAIATNLSADLYDRGESVRGRELAKDTLDHYERRFGPDHVFTLTCANNLAVLHRLTGEPETALDMSTRTTDRFRRLLGPQHPYTLTSMLNHATDLAENGDHSRAVTVARAAYEGLKDVLGPDHYLSIAAASNLAVELRQDTSGESASAHAEADRLHDDAERRARESKELGGDHPLTRAVTRWQAIDADIEPPVT